MDKIKIITIFKTFTKKDLVRLGEFLSSPYFSKGRKYIIRFYKELIKFHPDYDDINSLKKRVYSKLYAGEAYSDVRFRKLTSELQKLVLDFLSVETFLSDNNLRQQNIIRQLSERKLEDLFGIELKKAFDQLKSTGLRNYEYNHRMYDLVTKQKFFYFMRKRSHALEKYDSEMEYFTKYTLSLFLSKYIERVMEQRFFKSKKFELPLFDEIISYLKSNNFMKDPVINILYLQLILCQKDDDESYFKLRKLILKEEKKIDSNQLNIAYTILSNYAAERSEKGTQGFSEETLNVNLEVVSRRLTEQYISPFLFINIVNLLLKFRRISELNSFINSRSDLLNPSIKDSVLNYCLACTAFYKKDYDEALVRISKINFSHYQLKFQIKNLTLKVYYEQNQHEAIFSLIDSYKHILKREAGIPESIKKTINGFLIALKQMTEIKSGKKKIEKDLLLKEVAGSIPADKLWLLEKIKEL